MYMLGDRKVQVVGRSCTYMLWWLWLNPKVIEWYDVCVLWGLNFHVLYVHMLCWSRAHMCTCFYDHILSCLLAYMITCFYVDFFLISQTSMYTYFVDHTLLCSHASIIVCSYVYMLCRELVHFSICLNAHMLGHFNDWMLLCQHTSLMITCFDGHILPCLHALSVTLIIASTQA